MIDKSKILGFESVVSKSIQQRMDTALRASSVSVSSTKQRPPKEFRTALSFEEEELFLAESLENAKKLKQLPEINWLAVVNPERSLEEEELFLAEALEDARKLNTLPEIEIINC